MILKKKTPFIVKYLRIDGTLRTFSALQRINADENFRTGKTH